MKSKFVIISFLVIGSALLAVSGLLVYREYAPEDQSAATVSCADSLKVGMIDVTCAPYNADPTCVKDSTAGIQKAINDAYDKNMITFFPSGTYCVSNTLEGRKLYTNHGIGRSKGHDLVGTTQGEVPTIRLKPNSPGFGDQNSPKPVIWLHTVCAANVDAGGGCSSNGLNPVGSEMPASGFMSTVRSLNVEVENGNSGAVGIAMWGAQNNSLLHIKINLKSGFAGFSGMVGDNSAISDLEVVGGKHGITTKFGGNAQVRWPVMTNLRLYNQSDAAITDYGITNWMFTGLHIKKNSGPAIVTTHDAATEQNFTIVDGMIEFNQVTTEPVIKNDKDKAIALIDVYVKNANTIIKNPNNELKTVNSTAWNKVTTYGHPGKEGRNLINGSVTTQTYSEPVTTGNPPADILSKHSINKTDYPSPDVILDRIAKGDKTVANVLDHGIVASTTVDNAPKIQQLIDSGVEIIFFPKGTYSIGKTLELSDKTHLTGISNMDSKIAMTESWKPTAANPATLIRTKNSATASPKLSFLWMDLKNDVTNGHYNPAIHVRSGRTEFVEFILRAAWAPAGGVQHPNKFITMSDNAGGRFWGLTSGQLNRSNHQDYRHLLITGTSNPIIIYGANPEDQLHPAIGVEMTNAKNVALYGAKQENDNTMLIHQGSSNIAIFAMSDHRNTVVNNVNNIMGSFYPKFHVNATMLKETYNNQTNTITSNNEVGLFTRGKVDFSKLKVAGSGVSVTVPQSTIPAPTNTAMPTNTGIPQGTAIPTNTRVPNTGAPTATSPQGNICGKADVDGDGRFTIADFSQFASAYGNGQRACADKDVNYGACGGRDVNRDGSLNIFDFGAPGVGFAQRYYPKTSCALN